MSELQRIRRRRLTLQRETARLAIYEALADLAFDIRQVERLRSDERIAHIRDCSREERARVEALIARDRSDRLTDAMRDMAEIEIGEGRFLNIADAVVGPTPEWLTKGDTVPFPPPLPENARNEVAKPPRTSRRVQCPQAYRQLRGAVIDYEGYRACCWLDDLNEASGMTGACATTDYQKEVFASPQARAPFTDAQCEAQDMMRLVREMIVAARASDGRYLTFLELGVIRDVPLHRATRQARAFHRRPQQAFARGVEILVDVKNSIEAD